MQHEAAFQNKNKSVEVKKTLSKTGKVKKIPLKVSSKGATRNTLQLLNLHR